MIAGLYPSMGALPMAEWRWTHFRPGEVACQGSGAILVVPAFLDRMDKLRRSVGQPIIINSWYRSPSHNARVSTTGPNGPHTTGRAVDLSASGAFAFLVMRVALELGFTGVGLKQHGSHAGRFVHLDDLEDGSPGPRPAVWSYV